MTRRSFEDAWLKDKVKLEIVKSRVKFILDLQRESKDVSIKLLTREGSGKTQIVRINTSRKNSLVLPILSAIIFSIMLFGATSLIFTDKIFMFVMMVGVGTFSWGLLCFGFWLDYFRRKLRND